MITISISSRVIKISAILIAIFLLSILSVPAFSGAPEKMELKIQDLPIFKVIEIDTGPQSFIVTIQGLGVEKFEDQIFSLAEVRIYNNQPFESGYAYCVLSGKQMQTVFQTAFDMGLDLRLTGTPVTAPEGTMYHGANVYKITSATSW